MKMINKHIKNISLLLTILLLVISLLFHSFYPVILGIILLIINSVTQPCINLFIKKINGFCQKKKIGMLTWISKKINITIERNNTNVHSKKLSLLSPACDTKRHAVYIKNLKNAVDNKDVYNIALTGPYGSGKSSILKSFIKCSPQYKYISISLAFFIEKDQKGSGNGINEKFEEKLEYSILQQLFYHVKTSRIPSSRFGRIERLLSRDIIVKTIFFLILIFDVLAIFFPSFLETYFNIKKLYPKDGIFKYIIISFLYGYLIVATFIIIYHIIKVLNNMTIKGLKIQEASLKLEEKNNVSIMNRYFDEILYLFQQVKYDIVIFEDIDRCNKNCIFTKLRELNLVLNKAEEIKHKIVFIYAIKDDQFFDAEQKTKFFDYIIPVIPYINASNSADLFRRKFRALQIPDKDLSLDFITDISVFVDDMRVLTNIVNEFNLYREILDPKLELKKLLAIILYKNIYPEDFSLLHQNKGIVHDVFANKKELVAINKKEFYDKILNIDKCIESQHNESLTSIRELKTIVIASFLKFIFPYNISNPFIYNFTKGVRVDINDLYKDENFDAILSGNMGVRTEYNGSKRWGPESIKKDLGEDFNYNNRLNFLKDKNNDKENALIKERTVLLSKINNLENSTLYSIANSGVDIFSCINMEEDANTLNKKNYDILKYLLEKGYIDELYFYYISLYHEGCLLPSDRQYLLSLKFKDEIQTNIKLIDPQSLCYNISIKDYEKLGAVNLDLLEYLLSDISKHNEHIRKIIAQLFVGENNKIDFIFDYVKSKQHNKEFIEIVLSVNKSFWTLIQKDEKHTIEEKNLILLFILEGKNIKDIYEAIEKSSISEYINSMQDYPELFKGMNFGRRIDILEKLGLHVEHLVDDRNEANTYQRLVDSNSYSINIENIKTIFKHNNLDISGLDNATYTMINQTGLNVLKEYVESQMETFLSSIMFKDFNTSESEDSIIKILNHKNLGKESKQMFISFKTFSLLEIDKINSLEIKNMCYKSNRVTFTWANLFNYFKWNEKNDVDETIETYLNLNLFQIPFNLLKLNEAIELDTENIKVLKAIILDNEINDSIFYLLHTYIPTNSYLSADLYGLKENRISSLISSKKLQIDPAVFKDISERTPSLLAALFEAYEKEIISNIEEYRITARDYILICENRKITVENEVVKEVLYNHIDFEKGISSDTAHSILKINIGNPAIYEKNQKAFITLFRNENDVEYKIFIITHLLEFDRLDKTLLFELFKILDNKDNNLVNIGSVYRIPANDISTKFMRQLHQDKVVGQIYKDGEALKAKVLNWIH